MRHRANGFGSIERPEFFPRQNLRNVSRQPGREEPNFSNLQQFQLRRESQNMGKPFAGHRCQRQKLAGGPGYLKIEMRK
jgi:hypothetical protein